MIRFYDVDEKYVSYLQQFDRQVPNIKYSGNNKFVCGIVLSINGNDYYAPISHTTTKQQTNMQIFNKGLPIATIRFSFMFPAIKSVLTEKNFDKIAETDPKYANLLRAEYTYCQRHIDDIIRKALAVYKIGTNKQHRLNYTCCDFKLLEEKYNDYKG